MILNKVNAEHFRQLQNSFTFIPHTGSAASKEACIMSAAAFMLHGEAKFCTDVECCSKALRALLIVRNDGSPFMPREGGKAFLGGFPREAAALLNYSPDDDFNLVRQKRLQAKAAELRKKWALELIPRIVDTKPAIEDSFSHIAYFSLDVLHQYLRFIYHVFDCDNSVRDMVQGLQQAVARCTQVGSSPSADLAVLLGAIKRLPYETSVFNPNTRRLCKPFRYYSLVLGDVDECMKNFILCLHELVSNLDRCVDREETCGYGVLIGDKLNSIAQLGIKVMSWLSSNRLGAGLCLSLTASNARQPAAAVCAYHSDRVTNVRKDFEYNDVTFTAFLDRHIENWAKPKGANVWELK